MKLVEKQLVQSLSKNKIFVFLMFLLSVFTSFMYFFVRFSIDVNYKRLQSIAVLNEKQQLYWTALTSNISLARSFLFGFLLLTGVVECMFYYRFFKENKKQLGCLKTIGYTDSELVRVFLKATTVVAISGAVTGCIAGYFASDILIDANKTTYLIENIQKGVSFTTLGTGLLFPCIVFLILTYIMYGMVRKKECAVLITEASNKSSCGSVLRMADRLSMLFPKKQRMPVRLALRNVMALILMLLSVFTMLIMFNLAYALNKSSEYISGAQMEGRYYESELRYDFMMQALSEDLSEGQSEVTTYSKSACELQFGKKKDSMLRQTVGAFDESQKLFELIDKKGKVIPFPKEGEIVVSEHIATVYHMNPDDIVKIRIGEETEELKITGVARNAESNWVYMQKEQLNQMLGYSKEAYCGIVSNAVLSDEDALVITREEREKELLRNSVSNQMSAVIVQVMGCVIGCILLLLAVALNFNSNLSDMRILRMLGYKTKEIRHLLVDVYKPVILVGFFLLLLPAFGVVKIILNSLSMQIEEYLHFETGVGVNLLIFGIIWIIYFAIQGLYGREKRKR